MSDNKNGDIPAGTMFDGDGIGDTGLTKREMFAMAAMQGLCANGSHAATNEVIDTTEQAVYYADSLLNALAE